MTDKTLIGIGVAAIATPVIAFCIFGGMGGASASKTVAPAPTISQNTSKLPASSAQPLLSKAERPPGADVPAQSINVKPADLEALARSVDLTDAPTQDFKKEKWTKAIPVAEKLLQGSCDCEQRNWLTQFVTTGNYALAGAPEYHQYAQMLATLYRNDQELATGVPSN